MMGEMRNGSRIGSCEYGSNMHTFSMIVSRSYQVEEIHQSDLMQSSATPTARTPSAQPTCELGRIVLPENGGRF